MYKVTLTTPRGILEFNIKKLQELEKILLENSDYTSVEAKQEKVKEIKYGEKLFNRNV